MSEPTKEILISGYYGSDNAGDEAILAGLAGALGRLRPDARITAISADPAATRRAHGIEAVGRFDFSAIKKATAKTDLLISGGGGLLQDTTSWRSPLYYLWVMWQAQRQRVPVAALFQGIGPLRRRWLRRLAARVYRRLDLIVVRDAASKEALAEIGVPAAAIGVGADAAWLLSPVREGEATRVLQDARVSPKQPTIGIFLRPVPGTRPAAGRGLWKAVAGALDAFLAKYGGQALFVPMQRSVDLAAAREVTVRMAGEAHLLEAKMPPAVILRLAGMCDMVVAMRLHGLIFAAAQGTPLAGISYDPKVEAFLGEMEAAPGLAIEAITPEVLFERLEQCWQQREALGGRLQIIGRDARQKCEQGMQEALGLLNN